MNYALSRRRFGLDLAIAFGFLFCLLFLVWSFKAPLRVLTFPLGLWVGLAFSVIPLAVLAVRWPVATACAYLAFTPFNRFGIMLVYHFTGSSTITKLFQGWKEVLLGALLVRIVYDLLYTPERRHRILFMDLLVLTFVLLGTLYMLWPGPLDLDMFTRFEGWRSDIEFMLAFYVGRGLHLNRAKLRWLFMAILPGSVIVGVVALWQFVSPTTANSVFDSLGYSKFVAYQGMLGDNEAVRTRDIPGAETLPRASSLLLSDLALSFFQVFTCSLAAAMFFAARRLRDVVAAGALLALMFVALVVTLSRSSIACGAGALAAAAVYARSMFRVLVLGLVGAAIVALVIVVGFVHLSTVQSMVDFKDPSSIQHAEELRASLVAMQEYPFGRGIGTAGHVGQQQLGNAGITNESWYLQLGTEMGVWTLLLYAVLVAIACVVAAFNYLKVSDYWLRVLCLTVAAAAGAMLVLGNFLHAWENTPLSVAFWLLAGVAWRARDLEASPEYAPE